MRQNSGCAKVLSYKESSKYEDEYGNTITITSLPDHKVKFKIVTLAPAVYYVGEITMSFDTFIEMLKETGLEEA